MKNALRCFKLLTKKMDNKYRKFNTEPIKIQFCPLEISTCGSEVSDTQEKFMANKK